MNLVFFISPPFFWMGSVFFSMGYYIHHHDYSFLRLKKDEKMRICGEACLPTWGMDSRHQYM
jgi:hypothetical protein